MMKILARLLALVALIGLEPAFAAQNTTVMPTTGPMTPAQVMQAVSAGFVSIQTNNSGSTQPNNSTGAAPSTYQWWMDTSTTPPTLRMYDGAQWNAVGTLNATTHVFSPNPFSVAASNAVSLSGTFSLAAAANSGYKITSSNGSTMVGLVYNTNDNQMTVGTVTNHPLALFTNNSLKATIFGSGGVSIGASPFDGGANSLYVQGNEMVGTSGIQGRLTVGQSGANTAAVIFGQGGQLIIDYQGTGSNFQDGNQHNFRSASGAATFATISAGDIDILGGGPSGSNAIRFINDISSYAIVGIGGSTYGQPNAFFIFNPNIGFVVTEDYATGAWHFNTATDSTALNTGSVTLVGGMSVAKNMFVGGGISFPVSTSFGNNGPSVWNNGNRLILSSGTSGLEITDKSAGAALVDIDNAGNATFQSTTPSTSTITGAVTLKGGLGVAGALNVGAIGVSTSVALGTTLSVGGVATLASGTATPAGGSAAARLLFGTAAGFGIYYGSGAPTVSAGQGSIYIRSDGSSTSTRLYVNTTGSTTWTNFVSAL